MYGRRYRRRRRGGLLLLSMLTILALASVGAGAFLDGSPLAGGGAPVGRIDAPRVGAAPEAADEPAGQRADGGLTAAQTGQTAARPEAGGTEEAEDASSATGSGASGFDGEKAGERPAEKSAEGSQREQADAGPTVPTPATNDLWMSIPKMDLYDDYVANSDSLAAMDQGAIKLPSTAFPWQEGANTYIAAHRIGYPGTESDYQFYDLPNLALGDTIYLGDSNGTTYTYEVTGFKEVLPSETYVTAPQAGRDMISLQTCIEDYGDYWTMGPNWYVRYVVQADRVAVDPA
ncbi:class E sortase [Rubrobacter tropicus]|uniref:class E sortase n=1 Tax=Rubrobacter tropicus TaxID=2653851 RepID=UPI001409459A|nr:class E sortase [Rubrobacter tropicus]